MKVGFTGTREGMSHMQRLVLVDLLNRFEATHFVHGDCVGADEQAHYIALAKGCWVAIRPCTIEGMRARCEGAREVSEPESPLVRNRGIAEECDVLVAMPKSREEERRSGTWATVRYAREACKDIWIIAPCGELRKEQRQLPSGEPE